MPVRLTARVYIVGSGRFGFNLTSDLDCHVYLIDGGEEAALIDAGAGLATDEILGSIIAHGFSLSHIRHLLITHGHADHAGGAASLCRHIPGLRVHAHPVTAHYLGQGDEKGISLDIGKRAGMYPEDYALEPAAAEAIVDGQSIRVGDLMVRVLDTPGHSGGHHAFLVEDGDVRVLFAGDLVFHRGHILLQNTHDCDLGAYMKSLDRLRGLDLDALFPGHLCFALRRAQSHVDMALAILDRGGVPPQAL